MSKKSRGQFSNNRAATPASFEDDTTDKFEEDIDPSKVKDEVVDFSGVNKTPELFEPVNHEDIEEATEAEQVDRKPGFNPDGTTATFGNDQRTDEQRTYDEEPTEEYPQGRVGRIGEPGVIGDEGEAGLVGVPGPVGISATEESVEDEQTTLEDEREGEDHPSNDQGHEEESFEPAAPVFPFSDITTWTVEELELYISRPENMDIYHSKLVQAIQIHRQLFTALNEAWSVDECTAFFKEGVEPPKTTTGCYLNDVTRKLRRESSWTTQELEAWALGEIQPEGLVTRNGLAIQLHERFHMQIKTVDAESVIVHYKHNFGPNKGQVKLVGQIPVAKAIQPTVEEIKVVEKKIKYPGLTEMNQSYIEENLKRYCEAVAPNRRIAPKQGEEAQRQLHNTVLAILKEQDPVGVKSGLDILFTKIVAERITNPNGVFSDTNIFRFAEGISEIGRAQEIHRRLFTLFFAFIDGDEGILAQTDVAELVKYLPSNQQNQLFAYLGRS